MTELWRAVTGGFRDDLDLLDDPAGYERELRALVREAAPRMAGVPASASADGV